MEVVLNTHWDNNYEKGRRLFGRWAPFFENLNLSPLDDLGPVKDRKTTNYREEAVKQVENLYIWFSEVLMDPFLRGNYAFELKNITLPGEDGRIYVYEAVVYIGIKFSGTEDEFLHPQTGYQFDASGQNDPRNITKETFNKDIESWKREFHW